MNQNIIFSVWQYFLAFFLFVVEMEVGQLVVTPNYEYKREHFWTMFALGNIINIVVSILCYIFVYFIGWTFWQNLIVYFVMAICCGFTYSLCWNFKLSNVVLITVVSLNLQHISYKLNYCFFETYLYGLIFYNFGINGNYLVTVLHLSMDGLVLLCFYFLLRKSYQDNFQDTIQNHKVLIFSLTTVFTTILLNTVYNYYLNFGNWILGVVVALFSLLSGIMLLAIISGEFELTGAKKEVLTIHSFYEDKLKQYELTKSDSDLINIKTHDLKKEIEFLKSQKQTFSIKELESLEKTIESYDDVFNSGCVPLDSLINQKKAIGKKKGISINAMVDGTLLNWFKPGDIFALFSNLLDNAFEALANVQEADKKIISLVVKGERGFIKIEEKNYFDGEIKFKNGMPMTSKTNKAYHGYGTKSIKYIAKILNGSASFMAEDHIFTASVILPFAKENLKG